MGDKIFNIYIVGSTHLEGLEIDESLVPNEEYDLVLINPTTLQKDNYWEYEVKRMQVIIGSNPDIPFDKEWFSHDKKRTNFVKYDNLPRPQFLGLLKNCKRFITNSSTAVYEAPYFLKKEQIIQVGDRNKNRTQFEYEKQDKLASEKIVETLKNWWREK
jgi:UDP-N-acetylglucosamine 2-epimerase